MANATQRAIRRKQREMRLRAEHSAALASRELQIQRLHENNMRLAAAVQTAYSQMEGMRRAAVSGGKTGRTDKGNARPIERRKQYGSADMEGIFQAVQDGQPDPFENAAIAG